MLLRYTGLLSGSNQQAPALGREPHLHAFTSAGVEKAPTGVGDDIAELRERFFALRSEIQEQLNNPSVVGGVGRETRGGAADWLPYPEGEEDEGEDEEEVAAAVADEMEVAMQRERFDAAAEHAAAEPTPRPPQVEQQEPPEPTALQIALSPPRGEALLRSASRSRRSEPHAAPPPNVVSPITSFRGGPPIEEPAEEEDLSFNFAAIRDSLRGHY